MSKAVKVKKKAPAKKPAAKPVIAGYAGLPPEHQRFVDEYLIDFNATAAYMRVPGMTQNARSAAAQASNLLTKPNVQIAIKERTAAVRSRLELTKDNVIRELTRIALFDIRKLYRDDGTLKHPHELDDDTAAAVTQIEVTEEFSGRGEDREHIGTTKKVKLVDKKASVELAMKHLGLMTERIELSGHESLLELLR